MANSRFNAIYRNQEYTLSLSSSDKIPSAWRTLVFVWGEKLIRILITFKSCILNMIPWIGDPLKDDTHNISFLSTTDMYLRKKNIRSQMSSRKRQLEWYRGHGISRNSFRFSRFNRILSLLSHCNCTSLWKLRLEVSSSVHEKVAFVLPQLLLFFLSRFPIVHVLIHLRFIL